MAALGTSRDGLNKAEVAERLAHYGHNTLPRLQRRPWYLELAANLIHLFALLLWAGAGLAWVAGMPQLALAIITVILIDGLLSFWQEYQAERAAEALEALLPRQVIARRDGRASWRLGFTSNRLLLIGIVVEVALLLLLTYAPPLQAVFGLAPLGIEHWLLLAAFGPLLLICEEGRKAVWKRFSSAAR